MSKRAYIPARGDVVHANLGNTSGTREMDGPHFLLVISNERFNRRMGMCIVLPTTSKPHPEFGDLAVKLPPLDGLNKDGWIHLHQVRSIDFRQRSASLVTKLDSGRTDHKAFLDDLVDRLFSIVE